MRSAKARASATRIALSLLTAALLVADAAPALAEPRPTFELHDSATCALPSNFAEEVQSLTSPVRVSELSQPVRVSLSDTPSGVAVTLELQQSAGRTERTLTLSRCAEAGEAAVLLTALAIDPDAKLPTEAEVTSAPEAPSPRPLSIYTRAAALLDVHTLGGPAGGVALDVGVQSKHLLVDLGARYAAARSLDDPPAGARVRARTVSGAIRAGLRMPVGSVRLSALTGLELGGLFASASGIPEASAQQAPFLSWLLGGAAELVVARKITVDCGAELGITLLRPRLTLADEPAFYRLPAALARVTLGVRYWPMGAP